MNWGIALPLAGGIGVIMWIIIAAKIEADRMNSNAYKKSKR